MLELLNIRFSFLCRTTRPNEQGQCPIIFRLIYRTERRDLYTGLYCNAADWNADGGKLNKTAKNAVTINRNLEQIHHRGLEIFDELRFSGVEFSIDEIVDKLKGKEEKPITLVEYLKSRNEELKEKTGVDITETTYQKYERSTRHVVNFIENKYKVKNYPLARIDSKFLEKYFQYLRVDKNIGNNSAVKYITAFRTVIMPAIQSGVIQANPFRQVKFRIKTVRVGFLTDEEIETLSSIKLSTDLARIRDQFLFCCYTGLAYSDLKQLTKDHFIKQRDGEYYILKSRQKTGEDSVIPLLPAAQLILQKYSLTKDFREYIWGGVANIFCDLPSESSPKAYSLIS